MNPLPDIVQIRVVPLRPVAQAHRAIAAWRDRHPDLWSRLGTDELAFIRQRVRTEDGELVEGEAFTLYLPEAHAPLLAMARDPVDLDILVVPPAPAEEAERVFARWWARRPALRACLGEQGYMGEDMTLGSTLYRQYRLRLHESRADLLVSDPAIA